MLSSALILRLLSLTLLHYGQHSILVESCLTLHGQTPEFRDYEFSVQTGFGDRTQVISRDLQFSCSGRVTGWAAYSERAGTYATITFQVWRPLANATSDSCNSYQLVDSHTFTNIATDSTKLLNISSVVDFELSPIPFLAGDVVGFHADFSGGRRVSVQSNRTGGSISYYTGGVDSASSGVVSTCQDLGSTEIGAPVITAYVTMQDTSTTTTGTLISSTTEATTVPVRTTTAFTQTNPSTTPMTHPSTSNSEQTSQPPETTTVSSFHTTTDTIDSASTTPGKDESTAEPTLATTDDENLEQKGGTASLSIILAVVIVTAFVTVMAGVAACLVCVCKRAAHKRESFDHNSLSIAASRDLVGSRDRTDSHIYCEVNHDDKKKEYLESYSNLDNCAVFKQLECSCKVPCRMPTSDYEVPLTTLERNAKLRVDSCLKEGKEDFERTYETPMDAKMRYQQTAANSDEWRGRLDSAAYDVPKPVEEEEDEYTVMASVPREGLLAVTENKENIYESTDF